MKDGLNRVLGHWIFKCTWTFLAGLLRDVSSTDGSKHCLPMEWFKWNLWNDGLIIKGPCMKANFHIFLCRTERICKLTGQAAWYFYFTQKPPSAQNRSHSQRFSSQKGFNVAQYWSLFILRFLLFKTIRPKALHVRPGCGIVVAQHRLLLLNGGCGSS